MTGHRDISKEVHEAVNRQDNHAMEKAVRDMNDAYRVSHGGNYNQFRQHDLKALNQRLQQANLLPSVEITTGGDARRNPGTLPTPRYTGNETLHVVGTSTDKKGLVVAAGDTSGKSQARYIMDANGLFHEAEKHGTGYRTKAGGKTYYRGEGGQLTEAPKATQR